MHIDHVAVHLFLEGGFRTLTLHFPTNWCKATLNDNKPQFFTSIQDQYNWRSNPGKLANQCHVEFSRILARDSLQDIDRAISLGANVIVSPGFHARNEKIARDCDLLIAFSWSSGNAPVDGGTYHTWSKCKNVQKIHYSLHDQSQQAVKQTPKEKLIASKEQQVSEQLSNQSKRQKLAQESPKITQ